GLGTFVAEGVPALADTDVRDLVRKHVEQMLAELAGLRLSPRDVMRLVGEELKQALKKREGGAMNGGGHVVEAGGASRRVGVPGAVQGLSFRVEPGSVYGLLGKNGSGKTTTIRLLLGLLWPHAGRSRVLGEDSIRLSPACRQRIGYLSEQPFP